MKSAKKTDARESTANPSPSPPDAIGPHGDKLPNAPGMVLGGGSEGTAPLNFDDEEIYSGRAKALRGGGTADAQGGDSGRLGPPAEQLSDTDGPSDPDLREKPQGTGGAPL